MKIKEYRRRPVGIQVHAGSNTLPNVRLVYEVDYIEGKEAKTKIEYGKAVFGLPPVNVPGPHIIGRAEKRKLENELLTNRPDLFTHIHAAYLLIQDLEMACLIADGQVENSHGQRSYQERHREAEDHPQPRSQQGNRKRRHPSRRSRR